MPIGVIATVRDHYRLGFDYAVMLEASRRIVGDRHDLKRLRGDTGYQRAVPIAEGRLIGVRIVKDMRVMDKNQIATMTKRCGIAKVEYQRVSVRAGQIKLLPRDTFPAPARNDIAISK